jgi:transposase
VTCFLANARSALMPLLRRPQGYYAGEKIKGRKLHIVTDADGNRVHAMIHTADIKDRGSTPSVLRKSIHRYPWPRHLFADGGCAGDILHHALRKIGKWTVEIIKRSDYAKGFKALLRRRVVQPTFAWLDRNQHLAKNFEQTIAVATACLLISSIQLLARRIASV